MTERLLPDVHYGEVGKPLPAPAASDAEGEEDPEQTPADVVSILGFDPMDEDRTDL